MSDYKSKYTGQEIDNLLDKAKTAVQPEDNNVTANVTSSAMTGGEAYSEDEIVIGKWIDGKPIYRKIILYTPTALNSSYTVAINDIDNIVKKEALITYNNNGTPSILNLPFPGTPVGWNISLGDTVITDTNFTQGLIFGSSWNTSIVTSSNVQLLLEYTKTTDEPGSFNESMLDELILDTTATEEELEEVFA